MDDNISSMCDVKMHTNYKTMVYRAQQQGVFHALSTSVSNFLVINFTVYYLGMSGKELVLYVCMAISPVTPFLYCFLFPICILVQHANEDTYHCIILFSGKFLKGFWKF